MGADGSGGRIAEGAGLTGTHSQFRGRRTGRKLNPGRADALRNVLPRYEIALPETGKLDMRTMFRDTRLVWLEIGFGNGEHLLEQAARHPDTGLIGCEPFVNGVSAVLSAIIATQADNIRLFTQDARFLLNGLPDRSIDRAFVLFADPWPKVRHNKRRMIGPQTLDQFARIMPPGAELLLATDDEGLAAWYAEVVPAHPFFALRPAHGGDARSRPPEWPATRYETKALAKGRSPHYLIARRE